MGIPSNTSSPSSASDSVKQWVASKSPEVYRIHVEARANPPGRAILRADEDSPWYQKTVLCLDGGGIRVYSSLLILEALMEEVEHLERSVEEPAASCSVDSPLTSPRQPTTEFLPSHYFDYTAGTSTGGLVAIMLGRLRMSLSAVEDTYLALGKTVFGTGRNRMPGWLSYSTRSRRERLASLVKTLRPTHSSPDDDNSRYFEPDSGRCRTLVTSIKGKADQKGAMTPFLFRSYSVSMAVDASFKIADVACASVATSSYFESTTLGGHRYFDAATGLNNPSLAVCNEITSRHRQDHEPISVFLSLGCGSYSAELSMRDPERRVVRAQDKPRTQLDAAHQEMLDRSADSFHYCRLDVGRDLQQVRLDDWTGQDTIAMIESATQKYLDFDHVKDQLRQCAKMLVERRRRRAQTMRWESFALGTRYRCIWEGCDFQSADGRPFRDQNELMDHFRSYHRMSPPNPDNLDQIKDLLQRGRTNSDHSDRSRTNSDRSRNDNE